MPGQAQTAAELNNTPGRRVNTIITDQRKRFATIDSLIVTLQRIRPVLILKSKHHPAHAALGQNLFQSSRSPINQCGGPQFYVSGFKF